MNIRKLAAFALPLGLLLGLGASGCYADTGYGGYSAGVGVSTGNVVGDYGYEPQYYDGYMVYYDDVGRPFYYGSGGVRIFVSPSSPYYPRYVQYYRYHAPLYRRWYAGNGYRYRGYRLQGGYYGGHYGYRYSGPAYRGNPGYRGGHEWREQQEHRQHEWREHHER